MCEDCGKHKPHKAANNSSENGLNRRDFVRNVVVGTAAGSMLFSVSKPAVAEAIADRDDPTHCYKRLFNTLNASKSHFAPPEGEDTSGTRFAPMMMFFKALFNNPANKTLIHAEFGKFEPFYLELCRRSGNDILAMIFSCVDGQEHEKSVAEIHRDFRASYPSFTKVTDADIKRTLDEFFVEFGLVARDEKTGNYWSYPFVFGMGDKNYAILIGTCFEAADKNKDWGERFWKKVNGYMMDPTQGSKVYQSWNPPKYRTIPAQSASKSEPGTELFAEYMKDRLHPFDRLDAIVANNDIKVWYPYQCGCMKLRLQKDGKKAKFANYFQNNHYDVSLRRSRDELDGDQKKIFRDIEDGFHENAAQAEDKDLMHLTYNFKKGDGSGYTSFMCNCHLDWCIQLRPRDQYWDQQLEGEKSGTKITTVQRALYDVSPNPQNPCNGCRECCNDTPFTREGDQIRQRFFCPAGAISATDDGIEIDKEKCLSCLLCVRNCFRVRQSDKVALQVTPIADHDDAIPDTHTSMYAQRDAMAVDYNWTNFRYDVGS